MAPSRAGTTLNFSMSSGHVLAWLSHFTFITFRSLYWLLPFATSSVDEAFSRTLLPCLNIDAHWSSTPNHAFYSCVRSDLLQSIDDIYLTSILQRSVLVNCLRFYPGLTKHGSTKTVELFWRFLEPTGILNANKEARKSLHLEASTTSKHVKGFMRTSTRTAAGIFYSTATRFLELPHLTYNTSTLAATWTTKTSLVSRAVFSLLRLTDYESSTSLLLSSLRYDETSSH